MPDLFYPETANILWKKARCGEMQKDEVWQALNQLQLLELTVISNKSLMDLATDVALSRRDSRKRDASVDFNEF